MIELVKYAKEVVTLRPGLLDEINGLLSLCYSEIEEGGSPAHEIELCAESIKQLIEEN
jgi:hypothetical protein